jgi:hypothetical protein
MVRSAKIAGDAAKVNGGVHRGVHGHARKYWHIRRALG